MNNAFAQKMDPILQGDKKLTLFDIEVYFS